MAWNRKNQEKYRKTEKYKLSYLKGHLKRKYGLSLEEYNELLSSQNYQCKICFSSGNDRKWKDGREQFVAFHVDHDHITGKVRGLLCNKCNVGLAMFKENITTMTNAISYLLEK